MSEVVFVNFGNVVEMEAYRNSPLCSLAWHPKKSYDLHKELLLAEAFVDFHMEALKRGYPTDIIILAQDYAERAMDIMDGDNE